MTILIDNFSIDIKEWVCLADFASFSVDVVDFDYAISTSGTCFKHDGIIVNTTFSGITNGYKVFYIPSTPSGNIDLVIHAENVNNDIKEENYNILFGYNILFDEIIDWGYNKEIDIWTKASNTSFCPNTETYASYFKTKDLCHKDLNVTIGVTESVNLTAEIFPQSTAFFYDMEYTVTISGVRDFSGNELSLFSFTFKIEDI